jgi:cobalt-precorrin 5A hydrolase/precorrin-3B C17-methyltransferase
MQLSKIVLTFLRNAIARNLGRKGQFTEIKTLDRLRGEDADMRTVIFIGSSKTRVISRPNNNPWVYTPRRFDL